MQEKKLKNLKYDQTPKLKMRQKNQNAAKTQNVTKLKKLKTRINSKTQNVTNLLN